MVFIFTMDKKKHKQLSKKKIILNGKEKKQF